MPPQASVARTRGNGRLCAGSNRRYGIFYCQIMSKRNGADHMQVGHTTELNWLPHP